MNARVVIVEDHKLVSEGLESMLSLAEGIDVAGAVASAEATIDLVTMENVDVVLMDINLGSEESGIVAAARIKKSFPEIKVLFLSMFTDPGTVAEAVKAGADGYLSKSASGETVVRAIHDVMAGRSVLDPHVTEGILGRVGKTIPSALTDREHRVLQELTHGSSARVIGDQMHLSEDTVKGHLKSIYRKLEVKDRAEAVAEAFRRGLVH